MKLKLSIVIPTMTTRLVEKCLASLVKYTDLNDVEIIIIANGADAAMRPLIEGFVLGGIPVRLIWSDVALGAVPALNVGIREAKGEFVLLFNDDCEILPSARNFWLDSLLAPFSDPKMAVTGPFKMQPVLGVAGDLALKQEDAEYGFILFFMALVRRTMFGEIGLLDEALYCGVDIDFCMKLRRKGYKITEVPPGERMDTSNPTHYSGSYPIWHEAEATVHSFYGLEEWHRMMKADARLLEERYGTKKGKKVSIVIPTFGDSLEGLRKCVESVQAHTDPSLVEIVIVANGCTKEVHDYIDKILGPVTLLWFDEALGFPAATNAGIKESWGEFIILLNHDAVILGDMWLPYLLAPFDDSKMGITGPVNGGNSDTGRNFVMFFCACVRRKVFDEVGLIDPVFTPGGFEDIDFCARAENAGWKLQQVPGENLMAENVGFSGNFPIYHIEHHGEWMSQEIFDRNRNIILERYGKRKDAVEKLVIPREVFDPNWPSAQKKYELIMLQEYLKHDKITKVLEIGSYRGGTAMLWAKMVALYGGEVHCCDLRFDWGGFHDEGVDYYRQVYNNSPYEKYVIEHQGNSHDPAFVKHIRETVGMVDLLFIDGDHAYAGVKQDFEMFFPLVKQGGYIIFHDVLDSEWTRMMGCHVARFWNEVKELYPYRLFVDNNEYVGAPANSMGIGVLKKDARVQEQKPYTVLCSIPTKNRYDMLALCVSAVAAQTRKPDKLIIYDDGKQNDLRSHPIYEHLFRTLDVVKIEWEVVWTKRKGQHYSHQMANNAGFDLVWRLDDDEVPEPDVLSRLLDRMMFDIGAVGGAVITPGQTATEGSGSILDIYHKSPLQWNADGQVVEVDHLYSSFLYRAGIVPYCLELSPVAHREETIFSHELKRAGWKLIVDTGIKTWHYRQKAGGIRSHQSQFYYDHDEAIFAHHMERWGIKLINMDGGIGDCFAFLNVLPALKRQFKHVVIGTAYPEVFKGEDVRLIPVADARRWCKDTVYDWMHMNQWKGTIVDAYQSMYGVENDSAESILY